MCAKVNRLKMVLTASTGHLSNEDFLLSFFCPNHNNYGGAEHIHIWAE